MLTLRALLALLALRALFALVTLGACRALFALRTTRTRDALSNGYTDFDFVGGVVGVGHDDGGGFVAGGCGVDRGLECVGGAFRKICGVGDVVLGNRRFADFHRLAFGRLGLLVIRDLLQLI